MNDFYLLQHLEDWRMMLRRLDFLHVVILFKMTIHMIHVAALVIIYGMKNITMITGVFVFSQSTLCENINILTIYQVPSCASMSNV